jgi:meiotically up-regulated gene 157 (Mug157) protein
MQLFAYLTNGHKKAKFYHDANDIPTCFALEWSFVSTADEVLIWQNTMDFGFSLANEVGYCSDGAYGGLGSVHSPGAWTLGYFQELAYAASMDDARAMQVAWTKIAAAMHWDGTFSEAVDPNTAECTSKAWFSWPGAMIGALLIRMRLNGQEEILVGKSRN